MRSRETTMGAIVAPFAAAPPFGNKILDYADPRELEGLLPLMRRRVLHRDELLVPAGETLDLMVFPVDAFVATLERPGRQTLCTAMAAGKRGFVGVTQFLDNPRDGCNAVALIPGSAWVVPAKAFRAYVKEHSPTLDAALQRYAASCVTALAIRFACYTQHNVDLRVARWLTFIQDETERSILTLSHRHLADLGSIRRPCVSTALSRLQREGIVRCGHGEIEILDRAALEAASCECADPISSAFRSVLDGADALWARSLVVDQFPAVAVSGE